MRATPLWRLSAGAVAPKMGFVISNEYAVLGARLDGTVVFWNKAAEQLYGHKAGEILGSGIDRLYAPADVAAGLPRALINATLRRGRWHGFAKRRRRDGSSLSARTLMVPIVSGQEVEHVFEVSVIGHNGKPMPLMPALAAVKESFPLPLHGGRR
jgi:PAS domain S-box-containing protein